MRHSLIVALALLLAVNVSQAQTPRYVTDSLKLEARSGPEVGNRIVRMLESGTRVLVLEERNGWSRIGLGDGEGWILSRFLMDEPSARNRVTDAVAAQAAAEAEAALLREGRASVNEAMRKLEAERDALAEREAALTQELDGIKEMSASAVAIHAENKRLKVESLDTQADLQALREDFLLLNRKREREWFLAGAGVLLGGMVLGLIIPKIRWKRRRGWGEL